MPGVPTSKGCDACRKVKKKCDELQPCTRCAKRGLVCQGSGQQRYKFKALDMSAGKNQTPSAGAMKLHIAQVPNDTLTLMFINTLEIHDVRYDISYYGPFLRDLPRRFGSNSVVDTAGMALVSAYPYFQKDVPPFVLTRFGKALKALRGCLDDPVQARSPDTLCAIYLIWICQNWIGKPENQGSSHAQAIVHLLKIIDLRQCQSGFARHLIVTLCVTVVRAQLGLESLEDPCLFLLVGGISNVWQFLEGIRDPGIRMPPAFWAHMMLLLSQESPPAEHSAIPRPSIGYSAFAMFPEYIHNPHLHFSEITATYSVLHNDAERMHQFLNGDLFLSLPRVHQSRYRAAYTVVVTLALLLNTLLRSFDPTEGVLVQEAKFFCQQVIECADAASCDRPLGAAYVPLCLIVALAAASDPEDVSRIEDTLTDYQSDFKTLGWRKCAAWLRRLFETHSSYGGLVQIDLDVDTSDLGVPGGCAMM